MAPEANLLTIDKYLIQAHFKNSLLLGRFKDPFKSTRPNQ